MKNLMGMPIVGLMVWLAVLAWKEVRNKRNLGLNVTAGIIMTVLAIGTFMILAWDAYCMVVPEYNRVTIAIVFAILAALAIILIPLLKREKKKAA